LRAASRATAGFGGRFALLEFALCNQRVWQADPWVRVRARDPSHTRMKVFGFAGWSGGGKTTLIEQLVPRFVGAGLTVSLVKHAHHSFEVDQPGKDSYRHRAAGCQEVIVSSEKRWVVMHELRGEPEPGLDEQLKRASPCDLLLVEGYKHYPMPKLEIYRAANAKPFLHPDDPHIVAIAADVRLETELPQFGLSDYDRIADFILVYNGLK
jgi:molybdopterin-guanine dinucleotide biosynthesis protein B